MISDTFHDELTLDLNSLIVINNYKQFFKLV